MKFSIYDFDWVDITSVGIIFGQLISGNYFTVVDFGNTDCEVWLLSDDPSDFLTSEYTGWLKDLAYYGDAWRLEDIESRRFCRALDDYCRDVGLFR